MRFQRHACWGISPDPYQEKHRKEKQIYDLRHEVIETQIKYESSLRLVEEYKEQVNALSRKIIQLEAEKAREV
jgi:cell division protein ZapA